MSDSSLDRDPFEMVAESFLARHRAGERPGIDECAARYPELVEKIRLLLPDLVMVEQDLSVDGDAAPAARDADKGPSRHLGDYRIVREVGRGGMGVVYEAEQVSLGRRVALKVLPGHVAGNRKALERFRREAKAAARLHHTNIVPVFEVGCEGDVAFYAMQFIQGQGLDQVIDELARLRPRDGRSAETDHAASGRPAGSADGIETADVTAAGLRGRTLGQVARSLRTGRLGTEGLRIVAGAAGEATEAEALDPAATADAGTRATSQPLPGPPPTAGLSTSAVLPGGTAVSPADSSGRRQPFFRSVAQIGRRAAQGLAHAHSRGVVHRDIKPSNLLLDTTGVVWITDFGLAKADDDGLTATGDILGTLRYMAPERFRGEGDARADIYALGLTLYELLTLRPAYAVNDRLELIERVKNEEPPRPRSLDPRIPRDLETIVLKAIDKQPARRYATAEALAEDLRRFLDDEPIQARRTSTNERFARWARHHPTIAVVGAVLAAVLVLSTIVSLIVAGRMSELAAKESRAAIAERNASTAAVAETYRAMLSEVRALRAGHEPGWRAEALANLARLATMATARRDLPELRTEATAALGQPDIRLTARVELPAQELGSFTFIRDDGTLVTASRTAGLDFWDLREGRHVAPAHGLTVAESTFDKTMSPLPDGSGLIVGTADRGVVFTDLRGQPLPRGTITQGSSRPTKLAIDARGRRVAVAWSDGAGITIHDVASGARLERFSGTRFALSPDGRWLACEEDSEIVLLPIDPAGARVVLGRHGGANALAFSPDGSLLAAAFGDHTTVLWDIARREPFGTLRGHRERVLDVAFSPDGEWIATASLDYTTRIWETRTGQVFATLPGADAVRRVAWSPTGERLATSTDNAREVNIYSITGRRRVRRWLSSHRCELHNVAADPRRDRLMTSGYQELNSWDLSGAATASVSLEPHPGAVTSMTFSPDGSLLATASWSMPGYREILIRDGETGVVRSRIPGLQVVRALAFDRKGNRLAFCGDAGTVVVRDLEEGRPVRQFSTGSPAYAVAFLGREHGLVTHDAHSAILFDIESSRCKQSVDLAHGKIRALLVDRMRDRLVVGFEDGTIGSLTLPDLSPGPRLEGAHLGSVDCLSLSPDGRLLATAGADRRIALRDASSFETLLHLPTWAGNIRDLTFNFSGRRLAVVGTDIDVDLWDLAELSLGLTAVHLAWDRPDPTPVPITGPADERRRPNVAVIRRPGAADPVALQRANLLINSYVGAFAGGRWADAVRDLQQARDELRNLHEAAREDRQVASQLGVSLAFLSNALRNEQGPAAAQASLREAREVFEAMREPSSVDLYNLACVYAGLSDPVRPGDASLAPAEREDLAGRAIGSLRRSLAAGMSDFALMDRDPDLDPLRNRPDFRSLVLDRGFPSDPFAGPSPLSRLEMDDPAARAELIRLSADITRRPSDFDSHWNRGQFFARHREWPRALADFREALRLHPPESWADQDRDTWFAFTAGLVFLQADDREGYRRIARALLDRFSESTNSSTRDRTAKINLFADPAAEDIKKIVDLADRSVRLGQGGPGLGWLQLTRGMASYRAGDLTSSANWLHQAEGSGLDHLSRAVARFYLAMAEHRLGHSERARALLQQASQMLDATASPRDWGARWFSVVETVLTRREAEALILRARVESGGRDRSDTRLETSSRQPTSPAARP